MHLISWISLARLSTRFENEVAINSARSINWNLLDMVLASSSPFLPLLLTYSVIRAEKVLYFSVFSSKQLNSPSNFFAKAFSSIWDHTSKGEFRT